MKFIGRPRKLDPDQATFEANCKVIVALSKAKAPKRAVAAELDVSEDTLADFFIRYPGVHEQYKDGFYRGENHLRVNQLKLSEVSASMAIFLGKNWLGQRDNFPTQEAAEDAFDITTLPAEQLEKLKTRILDDARRAAGQGPMIDVTPNKAPARG